MNLIYSGPRKKEFGIVGPSTGTRHAVRPGEVLTVSDEDGQAILRQYPTVFTEVKAPEPAVRAPRRERPAPEAAEPESPEE